MHRDSEEYPLLNGFGQLLKAQAEEQGLTLAEVIKMAVELDPETEPHQREEVVRELLLGLYVEPPSGN